MDTEILKAEVFEPVAERLKDKAESLKPVRKWERSGIEGWLKVEAVATLGDRVVALQNKGPDLLLRVRGCDVCVELKAATDCNTSYILGGLRKYGTPVLFLGSSDNIWACVERFNKDKGSRLIAHEIFPEVADEKHKWIVGLVIPTDYDWAGTAD
jgi:hypothetical protein